jgi:hypothetical protein
LNALDFDERLAVAQELRWNWDSLPLFESILRQLLMDRGRTVHEHDSVKNELALCLIGQGRFREGMQLISPARPDSSILSIQPAFNYAMAEWGETREVPRDLFQRVVELDARDISRQTPNYSQCLAIAFWAVGDMDHARERLDRARRQIMAPPRPQFSAWRYLAVTPAEFEKDLDEIAELIGGNDVVPLFMRRLADNN